VSLCASISLTSGPGPCPLKTQLITAETSDSRCPSGFENRHPLQDLFTFVITGQEEYESIFSPERFEEILYGESPTDAEILTLREHRIEEWLNEDSDADVILGYSLVEVADAHGNRGIALILCTGYSFSGLTIWVKEIFDTKTAAMAYLKENGSTLES